MMNYLSLSIEHTNLPFIEENLPSPILIVGMHNSGTSILAEIIHKSGIFLCPDMDHYESSFFSLFVNDALIMSEEHQWAQLPIMPINEVYSYFHTVGAFIKKYWLVDYLRNGYDGKSPWGFKDPRLCVLLPLYLEIFPDAKVVHIKRNPQDVAASLSRKSKSGIGILDDINYWEELTNAYIGRVMEYAPTIEHYYELMYEDLCRDKLNTVKKLFGFLELPVTDHTQKLLDKIYPSQIGSFSRYQQQNILDRLKRTAISKLYPIYKKAL